MERDRRDEYRQMEALDEVMLRFEREGPTIDASTGSRYLAQVDVARAVWEAPNEGTRQHNYTVTFGFLAFVPASLPILQVTTVTPQATLL